MKKAVILLLCVALLLVAFTGCAPKKTEKIKIGLIQPMEHTSLNQIREAILAELDALGLSEQIEIDYKNAQGDATNITTIINQFVGDKVDYILPIATGPAQAAAAATQTIPIVFAAVSYPVEAGLVKSMDVADGNITGVSNAIGVEEIFSLAQTLTPDAKTFGFIYSSGEVNAVSSIQRAKEYCDANGLAYVDTSIAGAGDLLQATQSLDGKVDAIFVPNDNTIASAMATLAGQAIQSGIPVYASADSMIKDGGFATVGIDYDILGKQVAGMLKRLIDGQSIAQNPVEIVSQYAKMVNTTTAEGLGIQLPQEVLDTFVLMQ